MANEPSQLPMIVLIVLVLVGAGVGAGYVYYKSQTHSPASPVLVEIGDNVTVTYIGVLASGPETGKVFDTSVYQVATNNATWPKALQFGYRGSAGAYTQLGVHVGPLSTANVTINNYSFVQVVPGFWQGIVGIPTNVSHSIVVPASLGYAAYPCNLVQPLQYKLPVVQTLSGTEFQKEYPGNAATTGATFANAQYGWTMLILSANASSVTVENLAKVGAVAHPTSWGVTVENITSTSNGSGWITLVNNLSPSDAGHVAGTSTAGFSCAGQTSSRYIVTAVNETAGTYTEDFNQEVGGQTLIFIVKVINLFTPAVNSTVSA
ncbi:MAG TPA: hypothetical protein VGP88_02925 [Thermoplasmata archaeon]|jgi:hypothetical protein|nr:hypothetical protein [Thermoplasmata archaeon]